jgi:hypothetical protein
MKAGYRLAAALDRAGPVPAGRPDVRRAARELRAALRVHAHAFRQVAGCVQDSQCQRARLPAADAAGDALARAFRRLPVR